MGNGTEEKIPVEEMVGIKFGRLTVLRTERTKGKPPIAFCQCDCGRAHSARAYHLRDGKIQSCGCLNNESKAERTLKDLTGKRFGRLVVASRDKSRRTESGQIKTYWLCRCDCGAEKTVAASSLQAGAIQSCGCLHRDITKELFTENLIGRKFNRLLVIERGSSNTRVKWLCRCDCGETVVVAAMLLKAGTTKSCGCYMREAIIRANSRPLEKGYRSGLLEVVRPLTRDEKAEVAKGPNDRSIYYLCACDCGNEKRISAGLLRGKTAQISCGCLVNVGGDSFARFEQEPDRAASKCYFYIAETIFQDCIKLGIAKDPDARARDSRGVYAGWRLRIPMRRDMAWVIENLLLSETKKHFRKPSQMEEGWAGWTELRRDAHPIEWYINMIKKFQSEYNIKGFKMVCIENLLAV
jgi:hypothetical protein